MTPDEKIQEMLAYIDKEAKRLCMNFASYAIGHNVKAIARKLRDIAESEDNEVKKREG